MASPVITVTIQAVLFSALSTVLAQCITAYQQHTSPTASKSSDPSQPPWWSAFHPYTLISFMAIAVIMTPPNYLYARYIEDIFPSKVPISSPSSSTKHEPKPTSTTPTRLSKRNTLFKLLLEQLLAAPVNTAIFLILANVSRGYTLQHIFADDGELRREFWSMLRASWRVWPAVSLGNLVLVPFEYRMMIGNAVGVAWGAYVALRNM